MFLQIMRYIFQKEHLAMVVVLQSVLRKYFLPYITRLKSDVEECVFLSFSEVMFSKPLFLAFPYIAHEGSVFYKEKLLNGIENLEMNYSDLNNVNSEVHWIICGHLNSSTGQLEDILLKE